MNVLGKDWPIPAPSGVAIGVFDGVHIGHRRLVAGLLDQSRRSGLACGILTFDPHPVEVLSPRHAPKLLTTTRRRIELLLELGADWVGTLDLADIRTMAPARFVEEVLVGRASTRWVSVGDDFRFGVDRSGDVAALEELGAVHGFGVAPVALVEDDHGLISSTRIRGLLSRGSVAEAARLLGRPHRIGGEVIHGDARGRLLGYPTANLNPPLGLMIPADGIYAVRVGGAIQAEAVSSIGVRPTFGADGSRLIEVHVFDFDGDLYAAEIEIDFVARLRGEERFESVDDLMAQMNLDSERARAVLAR